MRLTNETSLADVITEMLKKYHLEDGLWTSKIIEAWDTCLSDYIVLRTTSLVFKEGILQVRLNSSVIRNELLLMKSDIILSLNKELGAQVIQDLLVF